eukprot:scaffold39279_cov21-Tisochrysis_lutea.AAC.1
MNKLTVGSKRLKAKRPSAEIEKQTRINGARVRVFLKKGTPPYAVRCLSPLRLRPSWAFYGVTAGGWSLALGAGRGLD